MNTPTILFLFIVFLIVAWKLAWRYALQRASQATTMEQKLINGEYSSVDAMRVQVMLDGLTALGLYVQQNELKEVK